MAQQDIKYLRNWLVSISVGLLPKIKQMRLNFHIGKDIKAFESEIEKMKQNLLYNCGNNVSSDKYK